MADEPGTVAMVDLVDRLSMLRCPETGRSLELAGEATLDQLNAGVEEGELRRLDGAPVRERLEAALRPSDADFVYPVRLRVPDLRPEARIALPASETT